MQLTLRVERVSNADEAERIVRQALENLSDCILVENVTVIGSTSRAASFFSHHYDQSLLCSAAVVACVANTHYVMGNISDREVPDVDDRKLVTELDIFDELDKAPLLPIGASASTHEYAVNFEKQAHYQGIEHELRQRLTDAFSAQDNLSLETLQVSELPSIVVRNGL